MPRPSIKAERRVQILDAFGRCLARYGLEGASLERVAEEAGLARALIRHNVGNRDQLVDAYIVSFLEQSRTQMETLLASLAESRRLEHLIELLFDPRYADGEATAVGAALLAAVELHPGLDAAMADWNEAFVSSLEGLLRTETQAGDDEIRSVAVGIAGLYSSAEAMAAIDRQGRLRTESGVAARRLLATLPGVGLS